MNDSNEREALTGKRERNRQQRVDAVKRWVRYIRENPPEKWGEQQNRLVDSQLESARKTDLDADHYRRLDRATRSDGTDEE